MVTDRANRFLHANNNGISSKDIEPLGPFREPSLERDRFIKQQNKEEALQLRQFDREFIESFQKQRELEQQRLAGLTIRGKKLNVGLILARRNIKEIEKINSTEHLERLLREFPSPSDQEFPAIYWKLKENAKRGDTKAQAIIQRIDENEGWTPEDLESGPFSIERDG